MKQFSTVSFCLAALCVAPLGCSDDSPAETDSASSIGTAETSGDGDGDSTTNTETGTASASGDGDGDMTGDGDGDGDPATGDGDGDTTGDGDGDTTGDGDGDTTGDGDGDTTGDGDGDTTGDGDGDTTGDGDGDGTTTGGGNCEAPVAYEDCDGPDASMLEAIGIGCPGGDDTNSVPAANIDIDANNDSSWRVVTQYGNPHWVPNTDDYITPDDEVIPPNTSTHFLVMTTGTFSQPNGQGVLTEAPNSQVNSGDNQNNDNPGPGGLPAPLSADYGSDNGNGGDPFNNCDGVNDCSDSLYQWWIQEGWDDSNDAITIQFDLTVPPGTQGYLFDFAFFSSEWPVYIDSQYNDQFIVWSTSDTYTGNLTFVNDAPLTITALDAANAFAFTNNAQELAGTGYEQHAGTDWFTARGSADPGETFQLTLFLADLGDSILASAVAIDNFRWECEGCVPSEVNDCGIQPQ